jgi:hypothetical protein
LFDGEFFFEQVILAEEVVEVVVVAVGMDFA